MDRRATENLWDVDRLNLVVPGASYVDWTEDDVKEHMRFDTAEEADEFLLIYSKARGFAYRVRDTKHTNAKKDAYKKWVCAKEGSRDNRGDTLERKRGERKITREHCQHYVTIHWRVEDKCYRVLHFKPDHNHVMLTSKESLTLPSNNKITPGQKAEIRELAGAGVRAGKIFTVIGNRYGGFSFLGFNIRNLYNFLYNDMNVFADDGDSEAMLSYLVCKVQNGDKNLFVRYTVDADGKLCHLFWADSRMREDFHKYKDLICFDATYNTVKYLFPLVLLMGVNNHHATVLFGSCLMRDETMESYAWLLTVFMECMDIKMPPPLVITDSDKAMIAAIRLVFGEDTLHRLCSWHIRRNYQANCSGIDPGFKQVFERCMTQIKTEDEFEETWWGGIEKYDLGEHEWLSHMYEQRRLWVQHFFVPVFSAEQNTTQRCESINAFLKRFCNKKLRFYYFMKCHDQAVQKLRQTELEDDVTCKWTKPPTSVGLTELKWMELSAGELWTRAIYKKVQDEIRQHIAYNLRYDYMDAVGTKRFAVWRAGYQSPGQTVLWNGGDDPWATCTCGTMTEMGIPCRHVFVVLKYEGYNRIPDFLAIKRWTMKASEVEFPASFSPWHESLGSEVDLRRLSRMETLEKEWAKLRDSASRSDEGFEAAITALQSIQEECDDYARENVAKGTQSGSTKRPHHSDCPNIVRDPNVVRPKGTTTTKDVPNKKGKGKARHCSHCGSTSHDKRTCTTPNPNWRQEQRGGAFANEDNYSHEASPRPINISEQDQEYSHALGTGSQGEGYHPHQEYNLFFETGSQPQGSQPHPEYDFFNETGTQPMRNHYDRTQNLFYGTSSSAPEEGEINQSRSDDVWGRWNKL